MNTFTVKQCHTILMCDCCINSNFILLEIIDYQSKTNYFEILLFLDLSKWIYL